MFTLLWHKYYLIKNNSEDVISWFSPSNNTLHYQTRMLFHLPFRLCAYIVHVLKEWEEPPQLYWPFLQLSSNIPCNFFFLHSSTAGRGDFVVWSQGLPGEQGRGFDGQEPGYGPYPAVWVELLGGSRIYGSLPDCQYTLLLCGKEWGGVQLKTLCAVNGRGIKGEDTV